MGIQWLSNSSRGSVTIYETNITLNTVASMNFKNAYTTVIGFDESDYTLLIKPLSKEEASSGTYLPDNLHPISIKPSYGRINGKSIVKSLCGLFPLDFSSGNLNKFSCEWIASKKHLKVYLKGGAL